MYPCICQPCSGPGCITPSSCPSGNCLLIPDAVTNPDTSSLPCGGAGSFDMGALSDLDACTGTVNWGLLSWNSDAFTGVSIDSAGVISFTTTNAIELNTPYVFVGKAACDDSILSKQFTLTVYVKNACLAVICADPDQICNPCTGLCIDPPDVELS